MTEPSFRPDWARAARTGTAEAILCEYKSVAQIAEILELAAREERPLLLTRLSRHQFDQLDPAVAASLDYDDQSCTAILGRVPSGRKGVIAIVSAGTSDMAVAIEARRTLAFNGFDAGLYADVGVAGLWRLLDVIDEIRAFPIVIAVAGMEGALFSVLSGLVAAPVIAVPTSVGYGVALNGEAALRSALASCAPGLVVTNVDNGFGAAVTAVKMSRIGSAAVARVLARPPE